MGDLTDPDELELAALLCSRICHDVISPVGAISNGFEVMEDEDDESVREMALEIVQNNARKASARLQFARLAFGAMGGAGDRFPLADARRLIDGLYEGEKVSVNWGDLPPDLPKDTVKLLVNLVMIAAHAIPRGGVVAVAVEGGHAPVMRLSARGTNAIVPRAAAAIFAGDMPEDGINAHSVQPYYALRLARLVGMQVNLERGEGVVDITAEPMP